ncbi:MAG: M14 family metallopeptidase [Candidatus Paceibacterota bacterium]
MKIKIIAIVVGLIVIGLGLYFFVFLGSGGTSPVATTTPETLKTDPQRSVIGKSVEGREIEAFTFGSGDMHIAFVGGIHGGYEWNSVLLAYEAIDHLESNPDIIPGGMRVTIIPSANPDGLESVVGTAERFTVADVPSDVDTSAGRFNANGVDLNRNFDCNWAPEGTWRGNTVSAGSEPFSEPEADALRDFVLETNPDAVIFWHSAAGAVYGSECNEGILPGTIEIMNTYASAAGYRAVESFDAYPITGDVEGWLASIGIPSVTVELTTHQAVEWEKNRAGIEAVLRSAAAAR